MQEAELKQRLQKLDEKKLMDIVKNYKQYGYSEEMRQYSISLLEERGITQNDLALTGNLENRTYDQTGEVFASFQKNSRMAFLCYIICLFLYLARGWFSLDSLALIVFGNIVVVVYFVFLIQSFLQQSRFYKMTGDEFGTGGALVYLLIGMPFYIVMYFVFQSQMRERLQLVK
jgi:hypothetical protein